MKITKTTILEIEVNNKYIEESIIEKIVKDKGYSLINDDNNVKIKFTSDAAGTHALITKEEIKNITSR
jgi:hypothetical protein